MEVVKYLVMISGNGRIEEVVWSTIGQVARFLGVLNDPVWKWDELSKRTKLYNRVYNAIVVPTMLYGNEGGRWQENGCPPQRRLSKILLSRK